MIRQKVTFVRVATSSELIVRTIWGIKCVQPFPIIYTLIVIIISILYIFYSYQKKMFSNISNNKNKKYNNNNNNRNNIKSCPESFLRGVQKGLVHVKF